MSRPSIWWWYNRRSVIVLIIATILSALSAWMFVNQLLDPPTVERGLYFAPFSLLPIGLVGIFGVGVSWVGSMALLNMLWFRQQPSLQRLNRYGQVKTVLSHIEHELADGDGIVRIGSAVQSMEWGNPDTSLYDAEVWLTPHWLVYIPNQGTDLQFFRLDALIMVYHDGMRLHLVDRFDARWQVPGTADGLTRLAAALLARVPWVLDRFDADAERHWTENREAVIAQVERRRGQFQMSAIQ